MEIFSHDKSLAVGRRWRLFQMIYISLYYIVNRKRLEDGSSTIRLSFSAICFPSIWPCDFNNKIQNKSRPCYAWITFKSAKMLNRSFILSLLGHYGQDLINIKIHCPSISITIRHNAIYAITVITYTYTWPELYHHIIYIYSTPAGGTSLTSQVFCSPTSILIPMIPNTTCSIFIIFPLNGLLEMFWHFKCQWL